MCVTCPGVMMFGPLAAATARPATMRSCWLLALPRAIAAIIGGTSVARSALCVTFWGTWAMAVTAGIGAILGHALTTNHQRSSRLSRRPAARQQPVCSVTGSLRGCPRDPGYSANASSEQLVLRSSTAWTALPNAACHRPTCRLRPPLDLTDWDRAPAMVSAARPCSKASFASLRARMSRPLARLDERAASHPVRTGRQPRPLRQALIGADLVVLRDLAPFLGLALDVGLELGR